MQVEKTIDNTKIRYPILGFAHPPILRPTSSSDWTDFEKKLEMLLKLPKKIIEMSKEYRNLKVLTKNLDDLSRIKFKNRKNCEIVDEIKEFFQIRKIDKDGFIIKKSIWYRKNQWITKINSV